MKDCKYIESHEIHRYYDNELDARLAREVELHLPACPACRDALASFGELRTALRTAFDDAPTPELTLSLLRRAREAREQSPRRIALGLLAAASVLFVSSLFLVVYTEVGRSGGERIMAQWEENVVWTPSADDEFADTEAATLYAIHLHADATSEDGND